MAEPFDLFGFLEARTFPTEDVVVLTNEQLGLEATPLVEKRKAIIKKNASAEKNGDPEIKAIDAKLKKIQMEASKSALTFHLRGIPQHLVDELFKADDGKGSLRCLAAMLTGVTGPDGTSTQTVFSVEDVERMYGILPPQGARTLTQAVGRLIVASIAFDGMADAGFLAKS